MLALHKYMERKKLFWIVSFDFIHSLFLVVFGAFLQELQFLLLEYFLIVLEVSEAAFGILAIREGFEHD